MKLAVYSTKQYDKKYLQQVNESFGVFRRLSACHNVLFTGHQAFLTAEALTSISQTTLQNLSNLEKGETCPNELV